jgi:flagellar protein FliO/FliZ
VNAAATTSGSGLLGMAGSLLLVLAMIFALAWLLRRMQGVRIGGVAQSVRVIGGSSVGAKERVLLIEAGGKTFLVGVAPGAVNLLHRYDEPLPEVATTAEMPPFARKLQGLLRGERS